MVLFEIHQRFKCYFLNGLRISFKVFDEKKLRDFVIIMLAKCKEIHH